MSGEINFSGLATGIDFNELVAKYVEAEKYHANQLEDWKQEWQTKKDKLNELSSKLSSVETAMETLKSANSFFSRLASSSSTTVADIAVDSTASPGAYSLTVASSSKHIAGSRGTDDPTSTAAGELFLADGDSIEVYVGGSLAGTVSAVGSDMSMNQVAAAIDALGGVSAEVSDDSSSSAGNRIRVTSDTAGSAGEISFVETAAAADQFFVNGIDSVEVIDAKGGNSLDNGATGDYTGHVNKRFTIEVVTGGKVDTDTLTLRWTDDVENRSGTITVNSAGDYDITQGLQLKLDSGETFVKGATYAIDVFAPDLQLGQDTGLAQAEKEVHSGWMDRDTTAITTADATFSYSFAGRAVTPISVPSGATLEDLKDLINNDADNPGVKATIINDGSGSTTAYHLVLTSERTGAANKIEIDTGGAGWVSQFSGANMGFEETQRGTNSLVKLDGYPNGDEYLQNTSNLISGLIDGASITLKSSGTTELSISNDNDAMVDKVRDFVDAYNDAMAYIKDITEVVLNNEGEAVTEDSGILVGNYGVLTAEAELKNFITTSAVGFEDGTDPYTLLSQLGITTGDESQLELDESVLTEALGENPDELVEYFSADRLGVSSNTNVSYYGYTSSTQPGEYNFKVVIAGGVVTSATYWGEDETEADAKNFSVSGNKYLTAMSGDAAGMALELINTTDGTYEGTIRIKQGKGEELEDVMEKLIDDTSGTIKVLTKNYDRIMSNIDKKIDRELYRVALVEQRMKERYARLEVTIQNYNSQMERLQSELAKLPNIG